MKSTKVHGPYSKPMPKAKEANIKKRRSPRAHASKDIDELESHAEMTHSQKKSLLIRNPLTQQDKTKTAIESPQNLAKPRDIKIRPALLEAIESIGTDLVSGTKILSLMNSSFQNSTPYVFAQVFVNSKECVYIDGQSLYDEAKRIGSRTADALLGGVLSTPAEKLILIGVAPWSPDGFQLSILEKKSRSETLDDKNLLTLLNSGPSSWSRGVAYARFSLGIGVPKDKKIANFLFSSATPSQKQSSLDAALVFAAHQMSPEVVRLLLDSGANAAPCVQSDEFLPLTTAAKSGQVESVKLLLTAGADPRQAASLVHGTALSWSERYPEIQKIFLEHLKDKKVDVILRPSITGEWVEQKPIQKIT